MPSPDVSVVIPYYEGQRWIVQTLDSVRSQAGVSLEVVIVDDGSSNSARLALSNLSDVRVRFIEQVHAGKGAALNRGITEARADILCVFDQDDIMLPDRLQRQLATLRARPDVDGVYSDYERVTEEGDIIDRFIATQDSASALLHDMALGKGSLTIQTMTLRKDCMLRIGGFCEDRRLTGLDDAEFFARLLTSDVRLLYVPGVFAQWISHGENFSRSESFNEARLVLLERLSALASQRVSLSRELHLFRRHGYYMRGLFSLEHDRPRKAFGEFCQSLRFGPFEWSLYYLLVKATWRGLIPGRRA